MRRAAGVWMVMCVVLWCQSAARAQRNPEVEIDRWPGVVPVYTCHQVPDGAMRIDGRLTEGVWAHKPRITFADLTYGTPPAHDGYAMVVWDSTNLYVGYHFVQPKLWAEISSTEPHYDSEAQIMLTDQFCKIFIDPDGDGRNYLEWHINPAGATADLLLTRPSNMTASFELGLPFAGYANTSDWTWAMPGLQYAVHLDGTLNNSKDTDTGWEVEVAIPWAGLAPYTKHDGPPVYAKTWRMHLGRVEREVPGGTRTYWTWPVLGVEQCHLPSRWGILYFLPSAAVVAPTPTSSEIVPDGTANSNTGGLAAGLIGAGLAFAAVGVVRWGRGRIRAKRGNPPISKDNAGPETARRLE